MREYLLLVILQYWQNISNKPARREETRDNHHIMANDGAQHKTYSHSLRKKFRHSLSLHRLEKNVSVTVLGRWCGLNQCSQGFLETTNVVVD